MARRRRRREYSPPLDPGVAPFVELLNAHGVETYESCQGGEGHTYPEPAVRFHGGRGEGFRALGIAQMFDLPVAGLRRVWDVIDDDPTGPTWEIVFATTADDPRYANQLEILKHFLAE